MDVFLTDGNQRSTLAATRALGAAGYKVAVGESTHQSMAGVSRFCAKSFRYPSPTEQPARFVEWIQQEVTAKGVPVMATTDVAMQRLCIPLVGTDSGCMMPSPAAWAIAYDKRKTHLIARRFLPCPKTWMVNDSDRIENIADSVRFPAAIKPRYSRYLDGIGCRIGNVTYAASRDELIWRYREMQAHTPSPIVQEKIDGPGEGLFVLLWHGELIASFAHRRLREKPASGGQSVLSESVPTDPKLLVHACELLNSIGWHGVAMLEFKRDKRDGKPKLIEINGRLWGSLQLAIDAGVDFPVMLLRLARGEHVAPTVNYRVGIRNRWFVGDVKRLISVLRDPAVSSTRRSELKEFFHRRSATRNEDLKLGDLRPFFWDLSSTFKHSSRSLLHHTGLSHSSSHQILAK
jgi:predicted ATP-grasp superfamily ATP-dependent carboligase